jgi:hypothetical protein
LHFNDGALVVAGGPEYVDGAVGVSPPAVELGAVTDEEEYTTVPELGDELEDKDVDAPSAVEEL